MGSITSAYVYDLENLNGHDITFLVEASIDLDDPPPERNIPRFVSFEVSDESDRALVKAEHVSQLLSLGCPNTGVTETRGNLSLERKGQEMMLKAQVGIRARHRVTVKFRVERAIRVPGNYILSAPVPADGIKIIVNVHGFNLNVVALHPDREAMNHPQADTWEFRA